MSVLEDPHLRALVKSAGDAACLKAQKQVPAGDNGELALAECDKARQEAEIAAIRDVMSGTLQDSTNLPNNDVGAAPTKLSHGSGPSDAGPSAIVSRPSAIEAVGGTGAVPTLAAPSAALAEKPKAYEQLATSIKLVPQETFEPTAGTLVVGELSCPSGRAYVIVLGCISQLFGAPDMHRAIVAECIREEEKLGCHKTRQKQTVNVLELLSKVVDQVRA
jgi:hypothetical protein